MMNQSDSASEEFLFADEEDGDRGGEKGVSEEHGKWKILIVDDEQSVHHVTKMVLEDLVFEGKPVEILSAFSAKEAKRIVAVHPDLALVLLDVVMETDDSGLNVVEYVRKELKNERVRIVIRTGQPGKAPEEKVIVAHDINDYVEKTELTSKKLMRTVVSSLRSYRDIMANVAMSERLKKEMRDRLQAEEELRKSEQQLQAMLDNTTAAIYVKDTDGKYLLVNRHFESVFHVDRRAFAGKGDSDIYPPEVVKALRENDVWVIENRVPLEREEVVPHDDGMHTYISIKYPLFDAHGKVYAVCGISTDITERKRVAKALATEKERLGVTLRSIGDGVIATDMEGRVALMNHAAEKLTGWNADEAMGYSLQSVFTIVDEKTRRACENPMKRVLAQGDTVELPGHVILIDRESKERVIADSGAPIRDQDGRISGVVLVFRDITEKRKMETELLRAQKLESVGVLAGGIAHDFNNLLTAILGNISLAKMDASAGGRLHDLLEESEKASLRAKDLTSQLLTFAKGGGPIRKSCSAGQLIKESAEFALRGSKARCEITLKEPLPPVDIDQGQISQVIHNLVVNADQAMPMGGTVRVFCEEVELNEGRYLRIRVMDQGVGIAPENLSRVFDPYFTTKEKGRGLGLATAYSIVRNHDGRITVASRPEEGTTFTVDLPVSEEMPAVEKSEAQSVPKGRGRVLVMDDDEAILDINGKILSHLGYEVAFSRDGNEAIQVYGEALESGHRFDAVIMDLTIPGGMGGKEAIARLREMDPKVRAIVSSGYSNDPVLADCKAHGFSAVISKPYHVSEMAKTVLEVIANG